MAKLEKSVESGLHTEQLSGRTQQVFFSPEEGENYFYPYNGYEAVSYTHLTLPTNREV